MISRTLLLRKVPNLFIAFTLLSANTLLSQNALANSAPIVASTTSAAAPASSVRCDSLLSAMAVMAAVPNNKLGLIKTEAELDSSSKKKSPLAPKPLLVRLFHNIYRWYIKKDTRVIRDDKFNYLSDYEYLKEKRLLDRLGVVRSVFSKEFDTRIYYTATGAPNADGSIPIVDPKSRGLYFYFHGSGTNKASGANFAYKANKMAGLGYSVISIDLPYHSDGSQNSSMLNTDKFYATLRQLIRKYKIKGMPVFLAGHSFGPDIAFEYFKRYPTDKIEQSEVQWAREGVQVPAGPEDVIQGVLGISPGGFNKVLEDWYMNNTAHMSALWGDIVSNDDGAMWAGVMSSNHKWRNPPTPSSPDPTRLNPQTKVHVLSGEWEEYVPGKLDSRGLPTKTPRDYDMKKAIHDVLAGAEVTIEPKVGHYIFEHLDQNGHDVVLRELLAMDNQSLFNEKELKATSNYAALPENLEVARKYARDPFFKTWVDTNEQGQERIRQIIKDQDVVTARRLINNFGKYVSTQRDIGLADNIIKTSQWNSTFYLDNKAEIDEINPAKPRVSDALLNKYLAMLEKLTPAQRNQMASVPASIYTIPERQGPPAHILDKLKREGKLPGGVQDTNPAAAQPAVAQPMMDQSAS